MTATNTIKEVATLCD